MLSRQRSACFLLEHSRVHGSDFVEMLRLIGYPRAESLKGEDFDWLCETNEEAEQFLAWLCGVVEQHNSLTDEQLEAYQAMLASGHPLLDADDLQSLVGVGFPDERDWEVEDKQSLEELEEEVRSLRNLRTHHLHSRNKMESMDFSFLRTRLSLEKWEKIEERNLCRVKEGLTTQNARCNTALERLQKMASDVEELHSPINSPNLFISNLDMKGYLELEEACFEQVEQWARDLLPKKNLDLEKHKRKMKEKFDEIERLRTAWSSQRVQLILAIASLHANEEALRWICNRREEQSCDPMHIQSLEAEIRSMELEITNIQLEQLPVLLTDMSVGPCLAVHQTLQDLEERRQAWIEHVQTPVSTMCIRQFTRTQMVEMGQYMETRWHRDLERDLQVLKSQMQAKASGMERRLFDFRPPGNWHPGMSIEKNDIMVIRLAMMLPEPLSLLDKYPKYETLQRRAMVLSQESDWLQRQFNHPEPQEPDLEQDCDDLYHSLCRGTRTLLLRDPSLTLAFETLSSCVAIFNQNCLDCLRDLEKKKNALQTTRLQQERQLYVYFYRDPAQLLKIVEDLEKRVRELSA